MHNSGEINNFCPKSCYLGPSSNLSMNVMQQPGPDLSYGTMPEAPRLDYKAFFWSLPVFGRKRSQNPQSARGPAQCKSGPGITWLVSVTIYGTVFQ